MDYNLGGNSFFLASFAILLPPQLYLGLRHKTWGFSFCAVAGLFLEITGYAARVKLAQGVDQFLMYIVCVTLGPAFFSAGIYLCLARIIIVYGEHLARFQPRTYTVTFMIFDFFALLLQASGGGLTVEGDESVRDRGLNILQAGLAVHVVGLLCFIMLALDFAWSARRMSGRWNPMFERLQSSKKFKQFLIGLSTSTLLVFIRTIYRVVELSQGLYSSLAQNETLFFILESGLILLAVIITTVFHPGLAFQGRWADANFALTSPSSPGKKMAESQFPLEQISDRQATENGKTSQARVV